MARSVKEWIGRTDDARIPDRVKLRVSKDKRYDEHCALCGRLLVPGKWDLDHIRRLKDGGEHRETNLQPLCRSPCHSDKSRAEAREGARTYKRQLSHAGIKRRTSRPFPTNKDGPYKKTWGGEVLRRPEWWKGR